MFEGSIFQFSQLFFYFFKRLSTWKGYYAKRRWFSQNRSQKEDRCLMRRTLVLSVRGKPRPPPAPSFTGVPSTPMTPSTPRSLSLASSSRIAETDSVISGWNLGDDMTTWNRTGTALDPPRPPTRNWPWTTCTWNALEMHLIRTEAKISTEIWLFFYCVALSTSYK